ANDADPEVRRTAYEAELAAWEAVAVPLAAAMNGIKGYQGALRRRRRWADDVEPTLLNNSIDPPTLEAMQAACVESFPDFRRYLALKGKALGIERLAWYDISAPIGNLGGSWSWEKAEKYIAENFRKFSERLAEFTLRAFGENW